MIRDKAIISGILFLSVIGISSQASAQRIYHEFSDSHLLRTLRDLGYRDGEVIDDGSDGEGSMIRFSIDYETVFIQNYRSNSLRIFTYFINDDGVTWSTLSAVNAFNRDYRWAKAYLDSDGDWLLEADFSVRAGVTEEAVEEFIELWAQQLELFVDVIEE